MIELPEAAVLAQQINAALDGKTVRRAVAAYSPHKFAWYSGDPSAYPALLAGKTLGETASRGGMVEIQVEDTVLLFGDGVNLRYHPDPADRPQKHQLLVEFADGSALSASVAMYGGLWCYPRGTNDNPYYLAACEKPSPLTDAFTQDYFSGLLSPGCEKMPLKAFLATQQRIPGLGNGVLQDILYNARLHPKTRLSAVKQTRRDDLYDAIRTTLAEMAAGGGRDTERDLFGSPGGYTTRVSKNTVGQPCPVCGCLVEKQNYMGGSIYFCPGCQPER